MSAQDSETVGIPARLETGVASLSGKTALVTGGSRGIGRGISRALAGVGVNVGIGYLERSDEAAELVREVMLLGGRAISVSADLRSTEAVEYLVDQVTKEFGAIDILVSSAGHMIPAKLADIDDSLWQATIDEQLRAALLLTRAVVPAMQSQKFGRIVYISSISAFTGGALGAHYAIAKAGLLGLMHWVASAYAREGITANAVAPSLIATGERDPSLLRQIPVGRFGDAAEVGEIALAILANGFITGQTVTIDGGQRSS